MPDSTSPDSSPPQRADPRSDAIEVKGAVLHNLKTVDCSVPHGKLTVVTGVSGSGKSSLAFDTIFAEGQRRYIQTFSSYARQFLDRVPKPPVTSIKNLQPTVALKQHVRVSEPRSTVGTVTEVLDYLALLFTALGTVKCGSCDCEVRPETPGSIRAHLEKDCLQERVVVTAEVRRDPELSIVEQAEALVRDGYARILVGEQLVRIDELEASQLEELASFELVVDRLRVETGSQRVFEAVETALRLGEGKVTVRMPDVGRDLTFNSRWECHECGRVFQAPSPHLFSFNTPVGACGKCNGFGRAMGFDRARIVPNSRRSVSAGAIVPFQTAKGRPHQRALQGFCKRHAIPVDIAWEHLSSTAQEAVFEGDHLFRGVRGFFAMLEADRHNPECSAILARFRSYTTCDACGGSRFSLSARSVFLRGSNLARLVLARIDEVRDYVRDLNLSDAELAAAGEVHSALEKRLETLIHVEVAYLTLARMTRSLSSGEYQRLQLVNCLNRGLVDTCFVLDEPTAGLHARDSQNLLEILQGLRDLGNTIVVVEHDPLIIAKADHVIELGPVGGEGGGFLLFEGQVAELRKSDTPTAEALTREDGPAASSGLDSVRWLTLSGAVANNLSDIDVRFPLGKFTCVTGVSGSGKSTLVFEVLGETLRGILERNKAPAPHLCDGVSGYRGIGEVLYKPPGRSKGTGRSTVLTRTGLSEVFRKALADSVGARERALTPFHFSANVRGGRCDRCEGLGVQKIDMHFMADVEVLCEECNGARFKPRVLEVKICGLNIEQISRLTIDDTLRVFHAFPQVVDRVGAVSRVGLGYLRLGQPVRSLSGGEIQRLQIAEHLQTSRDDGLKTLFLFDEPSVGLHQRDVSVLLELIASICERGDTVIAVEHNLQAIAAADWVIDLGPEAGDKGGTVVAAGTPWDLLSVEASSTAAALRSLTGDEITTS